MIAIFCALVALAAFVLSLWRAFAGPTHHDRALSIRSALLKLALVCAALAVMVSSGAFIDLAFMLIVCAVVLSVAVAKVFRTRTFQAPLALPGER